MERDFVIEAQHGKSATRYAELEAGDWFIFQYPHHVEQLTAWLYIREENGHRRINESEIKRPISENSPLAVRKISPEIDHENGMIIIQDLE